MNHIQFTREEILAALPEDGPRTQVLLGMEDQTPSNQVEYFPFVHMPSSVHGYVYREKFKGNKWLTDAESMIKELEQTHIESMEFSGISHLFGWDHLLNFLI